MPRHRYNLPIRVFLLEGGKPVPDPKRRVATGQNLDAVRKEAARLLQAEGFAIRSLSMGQDEVVAVVVKAAPRNPRTMRESARRY